MTTPRLLSVVPSTTTTTTTTTNKRSNHGRRQSLVVVRRRKKKQPLVSVVLTRMTRMIQQSLLLLLCVIFAPSQLFFTTCCCCCSVSAQEFNFEVERRILERLDYYMGDPVAASTLIENFRTNGVFDHDLRAPDRDLYLALAFGLSQPLVYYGLEDGTIPGFYWANGYYREPGNSGYIIEERPEMEKHLNSCVNGFTGDPIPCILPQGSEYISCQDGLGDSSGLCDVLEICPNQPDCVTDFAGSLLLQQQCIANLRYCRQYTIETNFANDDSRGFIPLTNFCIDDTGAFSEQVAGVIDPRGNDRSAGALTTCTHGNGELVQRNVTGDYACCGMDSETGSPKTCDTIFKAGYESFEYDPRYRPWYIETKKAQKPLWSPPYPFFTLGIGVTYTRPIYETDKETGREIFAGVLSVDYRFDDITNFLIESYGNSTTTIAIYESKEPNYLIGTSTGSDTASFVLDSDPTKPCPVDRGDDAPCSPVRIPISELGGASESGTGPGIESVLVNAAAKHAAQGYPKSLLSVKGGTGNDGFYVSQSTLYAQPGAELSWRVIIVAPGAVSEADRIVAGDDLFWAILLIGIIGALACFVFLCVMYMHRTQKAVIFADWRFTCAFIIGCILLNGSTFTLLGWNTDQMCLLRMWSFHLCFAVALAPLFVKIWRIKTLVGRTRIQRNQITNLKATLYTLPMILGQAVILTIFTIVDPPKGTEVVENVNGLLQQSYVCDTETNAFLITSLACEAGFVLVGCVLAYSTRHMNDDFGEAKQLIFAMYNVAFVGCMTVLITQVAEMDTAGQYTVQAIGVFWGTTLSAAAFVVPRLVQVQQMNKDGKSTSRRSSRTPSMLQHSNVRVSGLVGHSAGVSGLSGLSGASGGPMMESIEEENEDDSSDDDSDSGNAMGKGTEQHVDWVARLNDIDNVDVDDDDIGGKVAPEDNTDDTKVSSSSASGGGGAMSVDWTGVPKVATTLPQESARTDTVV